MKISVIPASFDQQPLLANLLELYCYDFTEFADFDIGPNGFYGYDYLPLYWTDPDRFPYIIYVNDKIAGFVLIQKGSPISNEREVWDISEFFIMRKYRQKKIGTQVALDRWGSFKGPWQVRVLKENERACRFWAQAVQSFTGELIQPIERLIGQDNWLVYHFESI